MLVNYEKQGFNAPRVPLLDRPMDLVYFIFFVMHIPITLLLDLQYLYPASLAPAPLRKLLLYYVGMSNDPLVGGLAGVFGNNAHLDWFKSFICVEAFFQLPVFFLGARALYKGSRKIYVLLIIYGASTATTTLPCLYTTLTTPQTSAHTITHGIVSVTFEQRILLLSGYVPFLVLPLIMTFDMAARLNKIVKKGIEAEEAQKWK